MKAFAILALGFFCTFARAEELPKWLANIYPEKLPSGVQVEVKGSGETSVATVSNQTAVEIFYSGYQADKPRIYTQSKTETGWTTPACHWCATGLREFSIEPGAKRRFVLPKASDSQRIFTLFYIEGTRMGGLIQIGG